MLQPPARERSALPLAQTCMGQMPFQMCRPRSPKTNAASIYNNWTMMTSQTDPLLLSLEVSTLLFSKNNFNFQFVWPQNCFPLLLFVHFRQFWSRIVCFRIMSSWIFFVGWKNFESYVVDFMLIWMFFLNANSAIK